MEKIKSVVKENKRKSIFFLIIMILLAVISIFYFQKAVRVSENDKEKIISDMWNNSVLVNLNNNEVLTQCFLISQDFDGIQLNLRASSEKMAGQLHVELICNNDQRVIGSWVENNNYYIQDKFYNFTLQQREKVTEQTEYLIKIWTEGVQEKENIYFSRTSGNVYADGDFYIGDVQQEQDVEFNVYKVHEGIYSFLKTMFIIMAIVYIFVCVLTFYLTFIKQIEIEKVFLLVVGVAGMFYMIIMPPFTSPDEPIHFGTAYSLSNEIMGTQVKDDTGAVVMREDDANVSYNTIPSADTYRYTKDNLTKKVDSNELGSWKHSSLSTKNKITHLSSAVGITIGRLLNLGSVSLIYLGRIMNLLFYLVISYFAIKITPIGKMLFLSISMNPIMLELISSYSYDAIINAVAFLSLACILSCMYKKEKIRIRDMVCLALLAGILAPCKMVYSFIFVLCIFLPKDKFEKKAYYYINLAMVFGMMILANVYVNLGAVTAMSGAQSSTETDVSAPESYSLIWCLRNPLKACMIYLRTTFSYAEYYFRTMFGGLLGWLELKVSNWLIYLIAIVIGLSNFIERDEQITIKKSHRVFSALIFIVVYVLVLASMLFGCTPFGGEVILGVQGRYFLPVLPLFVLVVNNKKWYISERVEKYMISFLQIINFVVLSEIFIQIASR